MVLNMMWLEMRVGLIKNSLLENCQVHSFFVVVVLSLVSVYLLLGDVTMQLGWVQMPRQGDGASTKAVSHLHTSEHHQENS